ncbi:MAG: hypothetical protein V1837_06495, partial [Candidatus Woesearchaeota archaeon]
MRTKVLVVLLFWTALLSMAAFAAPCVRDGRWGDGHQYRCDEDNTYEVCRLGLSGYDHVNICRYVCSADQACDGKTPSSSLNSCTIFGQSFLQDICDANCELADDNCEDDYSGCTADQQCDEFTPGQNGCNLQCKIQFCGDNKIDSGEQCELPNTQNNQNCPETTEQCVGTKLQLRAAFGDCNSQCGCVNKPFGPPYCTAYKCGAQCTPYFSPSQCDDGNPNTDDSCNPDSCLCEHKPKPSCGDGTVNGNEQCERPNTVDNVNCPQSTESCQGPKWLYRDAFGDCNGQCGCVYDSWLAICKLGKCGA